jgi:hypothetical protein
MLYGEFIGRCKYCNKPILWAKTKWENPIPINIKQVNYGNIALAYVKGDLIADQVTPGTGNYVPHRVDCSGGKNESVQN